MCIYDCKLVLLASENTQLHLKVQHNEEEKSLQHRMVGMDGWMVDFELRGGDGCNKSRQ